MYRVDFSAAMDRTLVDILAGKRKVGNVSGAVSLTNADVAHAQSVRVGYVDQADTLSSNLCE